MNEVLTVAEIHERFQSEWVLLGDPQTDTYLGVQGGTVLWHSKDRDEVYRQAITAPYKHLAVLYTGTIPEGTAVLI